MKRQHEPRLREMTQARALARCSIITAKEWEPLDLDSQVDLLNVMREYILNCYTVTGLPVPAHIADVWERCKVIIDREAGI